MITVLLVDEERLLRAGVRMWLEQAPDITVVGEASNEQEAMLLAHAFHPDVVLIDISPPTGDGFTATATLRTSIPQCAVVLLSLYDNAATQAWAQAVGAATLVGKQEGALALLKAIRAAREQHHW